MYFNWKIVLRQGVVMPFLWTELEFTVDIPEGITLRTYLTTEKEQLYIC